MAHIADVLRRFVREDAGTTAFSLMWLSLCIITGGLAVDISNSYRVKQIMAQTADIAAHAGAVAIAGGATDAEVRAAVLASVEANMPSADHGIMIPDPATGIQLLNFDPDTNQLSGSGDPNTVLVSLQRSKATSNAVPTIFLRLADAFDRNEHDYSSWDIEDQGIATFAKSIHCKSDDEIYARGIVSLSSQNTFGPRYCIHGQDHVWMAMKNVFGADSGLSMPDLADCKNKCNDASNPGVDAAKFEQNLIYESTSSVVARYTDDFLNGGTESLLFFTNRNIGNNLTPLTNAGIETSYLASGSIVNLTDTQFENLTEVATGLTYNVTCAGSGDGEDGGSASDGVLTIAAPVADTTIADVAIITDCALHFDGTANLENALLISTKVSSSATVTASSTSRIGTLANACQPANRTYIYALGGMQVPAKVTGSNVTIKTAGDINLAASPGEYYISYGLSLFSDADIHVAADHDFTSCTPPGNGLNGGRKGFIRILEMAGIDGATNTM